MPRRYNKRKKYGGRKNNRRRRYGPKRRGKYTKIQGVAIKQPGVICADRQWVKLHYIDTTTSTIGIPAANYGFLHYRSSAYDPNPLVFSNGVIGFSAMSQLYRAYRVRGMKITIRACNLESVPVGIVVWPSTYDLASSASSAAWVQEMACNAFAKMVVVSPTTGQDRQIISGYISTKKIVGSKLVDFDDSYQALVNTNPQQMWYWNFAVYTLNGSSFNSGKGIVFEARITQYIEFFDRQVFTT